MTVGVPVTEKMKTWAEKKTSKFVAPRRDVALTEERTFIGYLHEAAFWVLFKDAQHVDTQNEDFLYRGARIDVKGQLLDYPPNKNLHATIFEKELHRHPEIFVFGTTVKDLSIVYFVGWVFETELMERSFVPTEEQLKVIAKNNKNPQPCRRIQFSKLNGMELLC